jgi:hypothetical protein
LESSSTRGSDTYEEAVETGISLHMGPIRGKWRGAPLLQTLIERTLLHQELLRDMQEKALEMGISLHKSLTGGSFIQDFERQVKEGSGNGASLWEFCEGNTEGGFLYWGLFWEICQEGSGNGASLPL